MLRWIENYYVGSSVRKPEEMKEKINSGFFAPGIYLLTLSDNPNNLLEFLPAASLKQKACIDCALRSLGSLGGRKRP